MQSGWNGTSPTSAAGNGGTPPANSSGLMTAWCISCHTRYSGLVNANGETSSPWRRSRTQSSRTGT